MQNADIWCWNQLLYELSHNHWPLDSFPLRLTATSAKLFRYITCLKIKFCQVCMFNFISAVGKFFTTICKIWHLKWLNGVWETINSIVLFLSLPLSIVLFLFLSLSIILFLSLSFSFYHSISIIFSFSSSFYRSFSFSFYHSTSFSSSLILFLSLTISVFLCYYIPMSLIFFLYHFLSFFLSPSVSLSLSLSLFCVQNVVDEKERNSPPLFSNIWPSKLNRVFVFELPTLWLTFR